LGVDRKTLRKYTGPARAAGMEPGGPPMSEADWRGLVAEWFGRYSHLVPARTSPHCGGLWLVKPHRRSDPYLNQSGDAASGIQRGALPEPVIRQRNGPLPDKLSSVVATRMRRPGCQWRSCVARRSRRRPSVPSGGGAKGVEGAERAAFLPSS
jgi:hypothetical protein